MEIKVAKHFVQRTVPLHVEANVIGIGHPHAAMHLHGMDRGLQVGLGGAGLGERGDRGQVVVTGVGKSGLIGQKISATLASTGTPSNQRTAFAIPPGTGHPDGCCLDADGNLWVAQWGGSRVVAYDPADGAAWLARFGDPYARVGNDQSGRLALDLGVSGAPETFIIDRTGRIRYKLVGPITPERWRDEMAPLIAQLEAGQ